MSAAKQAGARAGGQGRRIRLDAYLARAGLGTRSEVRRLVRQGRVSVGDDVCRRAGEWVEGRAVRLDMEIIAPPPDVLHAVLHKPAGFACSHDPREAPIIDALVPQAWLRLGLQSAGRLDRATSGLLVLSSDGRLVHDLTHPSRKVEKRYRVRFDGELPADAVQRCADGLRIAGSERPTRPARLEVEGEAEGHATMHVCEGRFHQVRRMFERLGVTVTALHRDRVGDYALPEDLVPGELRRLEPDDLLRLRRASSL